MGEREIIKRGVYKKRKLMFGVAVNDVDYVTNQRAYVEGVSKIVNRCDFYRTWKSMIVRCYYEKYHLRFPTYKNCTVCEEWLTFSNFKAWMEKQDWEGKVLDKDLLVHGNKVYSKSTCVFVDTQVNGFIAYSKGGNLPTGVSIGSRGRITARINKGKEGRVFLGYFKTPMDAHKAWQLAKCERAIHLQSQQTDSRVIAGLQRIIDKLEHDFENNLETFTL